MRQAKFQVVGKFIDAKGEAVAPGTILSLKADEDGLPVDPLMRSRVRPFRGKVVGGDDGASMDEYFKEAEAKVEKLIADAKAEAAKILDEAGKEAEKIVQDASTAAEQIIADASKQKK